MIAFQCFSSIPQRKKSNKEVELSEFYRTMWQLSAYQYRLTNGPLRLYTDTPTLKALEKYNMLSCWDYIDTKLLDSFENNSLGIDSSVFWSVSKFICYKELKPPFVCIDTDMILWDKLNLPKDVDFSFSHWEAIEKDCEIYPDLSLLRKSEGYKFRDLSEYHKRAANMSITYINNEKFKNQFLDEAFSFMQYNNITDTRAITPEILYMEQRLPLAIAMEQKIKFQPIINNIWSAKNTRFTTHDPRYGDWFVGHIDSTKPFTHTWLYKYYLETNPEEMSKYQMQMEKMLAVIKNKIANKC